MDLNNLLFKNVKKDRVTEQLLKVKNEFVELLPKEFQKEFAEKCYIGGGAIYAIYNDEEVNDYDFFVTDKSFADRIHKHFNLDSTLKYKNGIKIGRYKSKTLIVTDNAISFDRRLQIITRWVGEPKEVINCFDFKHNMFYFQNGKLHNLVDWKYLDEKKLYYNEKRARDVANCIMRVNKFVNRGFTISNIELSKILLKLDEVGFSEVDLEILKSKNEKRLNFGSGD